MRTLKTVLLGGLAPIAAIVMLAAASGASGAAAQSLAGVAPADRGNWPVEPAGTYMTTIVKQKLASEYGLAWQSLYPPHQRVATLDAYVGCESLVPRPGTLVAVKVLRVFDERIRDRRRAGQAEDARRARPRRHCLARIPAVPGRHREHVPCDRSRRTVDVDPQPRPIRVLQRRHLPLRLRVATSCATLRSRAGGCEASIPG